MDGIKQIHFILFDSPIQDKKPPTYDHVHVGVASRIFLRRYVQMSPKYSNDVVIYIYNVLAERVVALK